MPTIDYPKQNVKYYAIQDVYLRADMATINQYCSDKGITYVSHTTEEKRFSNDGGLSYQYYGVLIGSSGSTSTWNTEFGFSQVVTQIVYTP